MTTQLEPNEVRTSVRKHYSKVVNRESGCGCAPSCCSTQSDESTLSHERSSVARILGYSPEDTAQVPDGANLGLGCGNPLAMASLQSGQTILDLGSGAGFDAFLAAKAVGPSGRVIGVDMTPEMLLKARSNRTQGNYPNVEFRLGEIENLPVADNSVDVIISNCVINLSPEKSRVFHEAFRVLKRGGRLAVSDIVAVRPLPESVRADIALHAGCVAGAAAIDELKSTLVDAGFRNIRITPKPQTRAFIKEWFPGIGSEEYIASATIEAIKP